MPRALAAAAAAAALHALLRFFPDPPTHPPTHHHDPLATPHAAEHTMAAYYSLGARALAEFVGMVFVIYAGESALANELLPSTKGHAMGWGWTVFTFGCVRGCACVLCVCVRVRSVCVVPAARV